MSDKIPLAEMIGHLDEMIAETTLKASGDGRASFGFKQRLAALQAIREPLVWTMNNRDACLAFIEGKDGE